MMLDCLPTNELGKEIWQTLYDQYNQVESEGITYTFNERTINEKHYDFSPLINALHTYVTQTQLG
ncbi:hypothetical protein [Legionella sp.]|uniref:hypothetical protein n=1 Tax=Legionella sp. TaxID=459 RepID=UPI003CAF7F16